MTSWIALAATIVATAVLSSLLTLGLAYLLFQRYIRRSLEDEIDRQVTEALERLGEIVGDRVRQGVLDAVTEIPSSEVVKDTTRAVARTGVDLLGQGLDTLLGGRPRRRDP